MCLLVRPWCLLEALHNTIWMTGTSRRWICIIFHQILKNMLVSFVLPRKCKCFSSLFDYGYCVTALNDMSINYTFFLIIILMLLMLWCIVVLFGVKLQWVIWEVIHLHVFPATWSHEAGQTQNGCMSAKSEWGDRVSTSRRKLEHVFH